MPKRYVTTATLHLRTTALLFTVLACGAPTAARAQANAAAAGAAQTESGPSDTPTDSAGSAPGSLTLTAAAAPTSVPSAGARSNRPSVVVPAATAAPQIDGRLDDAIWQTSAHLDTFVQQRPRENAPATEATDVYIAYDERNLYFGIHAHYSDVGSMRVNRSERDRVGRDDTVSVIFDPFLDQQRAYVFTVNGYGVQADSLMGGAGRGGGGGPGGGGPGGGPGGELGDRSWNALFRSAGTPVPDGWTAELAIPFKSLRYPSRGRGEAHRWGFQIQRDLQGKNETIVWSPVLRSVASFLGQMGTLDGLTNLSTSRNLEFQPTFTAVRQEELETTTGVTSPSHLPEAGLNVKYGLTSNLTADFTLNPDFSQIESDQPQIVTNQRFPIFYPEQRPFFLEGQEIFEIPGPVTFVHTRTIIDPQFGAKLTGKVGKTTLGAMVANDEAPGKADDPSDPVYGEKAQFVFGRARYDLYSESYLGAIVTNREFADYFSRAGGFDAGFKIGETHRLEALALVSDQVTNDEDDPGSHTGSIYNLSFRREGRGLSYFAKTGGVSPGFRNDSGFVRRTDIREHFGNVSYRWYPESWVLSWGPRAGYGRNYDYAGVLQDVEQNIGVNGQFAQNINLGGNLSREMERYVGINFWKTRYGFNVNVNTSRRMGFGLWVNSGDGIRYDKDDPLLGKETRMMLHFNVRPITRLSSMLQVNTSRLLRPTGETLVDAKIFRSVTTFQFTDRWALRSILERNADDKTFAANILGTYRVNAGTAFFIGYDDRYAQGDTLEGGLYPTRSLKRTNRAIFTKLQYLFRL